MRLQPVNRLEVNDSYEILASYEVIREVVNGITIDSAAVVADGNGKKIVKKGQPLSKMASGKYVSYNADGVDGSEKPSVILKHTYDLTDGDVVAGGYEMAKVISERLPVAVDDTLKGKMPNITFA